MWQVGLQRREGEREGHSGQTPVVQWGPAICSGCSERPRCMWQVHGCARSGPGLPKPRPALCLLLGSPFLEVFFEECSLESPCGTPPCFSPLEIRESLVCLRGLARVQPLSLRVQWLGIPACHTLPAPCHRAGQGCLAHSEALSPNFHERGRSPWGGSRELPVPTFRGGWRVTAWEPPDKL